MEIKVIRNSGKVYFEDQLVDGCGIRKARAFLQGTCGSFAKQCVEFHEILKEHPFNYRERQIQSVIFPAMAKHADVVFVEQPVSRDQGTNLGRLDYWVLSGGTVFLIEMKHDYHALFSKRVRKSAREKWEEGQRQLAGIPIRNIEE